MKLVRVGPAGREKPGVLAGSDSYVDVSDIAADFGESFFRSGGVASIEQQVAERVASGAVRALDGLRLGAPIARPQQILCVGLNYSDHAAETGQEVPDEPIVFNKAPNTLVGPHDPVRQPRDSQKLDWEVELGVVIGRRSRYLDDEAAATLSIAGYVLVNDVSERAFQLERGGQWVKGKSAETFNPCGPYLATPDEIADVGNLGLWLEVNGARRQAGNTSTMLFGPAYIVWYLSQFMVLEAGDLINTGTPPGVGMGFSPPVWLHPGDRMRLGIDGLGIQEQTVVSWDG